MSSRGLQPIVEHGRAGKAPTAPQELVPDEDQAKDHINKKIILCYLAPIMMQIYIFRWQFLLGLLSLFFFSFTSDCARICIVIASIKNKRFAISRPKHQEPGFMVLCTWFYDHPLVLTYTFYIWALFIFIFIETYFLNHHRSCFNHFKIAFYLYIKYILSNHLIMMTN